MNCDSVKIALSGFLNSLSSWGLTRNCLSTLVVSFLSSMLFSFCILLSCSSYILSSLCWKYQTLPALPRPFVFKPLVSMFSASKSVLISSETYRGYIGIWSSPKPMWSAVISQLQIAVIHLPATNNDYVHESWWTQVWPILWLSWGNPKTGTNYHLSESIRIYQNLSTLVSIVMDPARPNLFEISFQVLLPRNQRKRTPRRWSFCAQVPDDLSRFRASPFHCCHSPRFAN